MHYPERRTEQTSPLLLFFSFVSKILWSYNRSQSHAPDGRAEMNTRWLTLYFWFCFFLSNKQWWSGLSTQLNGLGNAPKSPSSDVPREALIAVFTFSIFCSPHWNPPHIDFKGKLYESIPTLSTLTLSTYWPYAFINEASLALPFQHIG